MKLKPYDPSKANAFQRFRDFFSEGIKTFISNKYAPFLAKAVRNRYTTVAVFLAMLILTIGMFGGGIVRFVFFPSIPSDFMIASFELEPGSSIEQRDDVLDTLRAAMHRMDDKVASDTKRERDKTRGNL